MNNRRIRLHAAIVTVLWCLTFLACSRMLTAPEVYRSRTDNTAYSVENALRHLRHIAASPHPVGSAAHDAVAAYLLGEIEALGYRAEVQETIASAPFRSAHPFVKAAAVKNILVRVAGKESGRSVLIAGHYDSAETSPGAADDGTAVASMLEVLRILKHAAPAGNDLIFLFSDAEEVGLLGSRAFVEKHPWARDCVLALNFEARGNRGVLLMFETGERNGRLVGDYARAAVQPVASSLMFSIYRKLMDNDTDFSVFRNAGMSGMNFAFIEGWTDYHTALDNLERLDLRSLALQGRNMLQLARHFADADLETLAQSGDAGYFNLPFGKLFLFPLHGHVPELAAGAALVLFAFAALRKGYCRCRNLLQCGVQTAIFLLLTGVLAGAGFAFHGALMLVYDHYRRLPEPYNATLYFSASCCMAVALFMLLRRGLRRWIKARTFAAGALFFWLAMGVYLALAFPGGVFFAVVPALAMLADWAFGSIRSDLGRAFVTAVCSSAVLIIVAPTLYLAHHALGFHAGWLLMAVAALSLGLILPALDILYGAFRWRLPAVLLAAAGAFLVSAHRTSDFSRNRPQPDSIVYAWDGISHSARWLSYDHEADDWTRQFLTAAPVVSHAGIFDDFVPGRRVLERETSFARLLVPDVRIEEQRIDGGKKHLRIHIRSRRNADLIRLKTGNAADALRIFADKTLIHPKNPAETGVEMIEFHGLPAEGLTFTFELPVSAPVKPVQIVEIRRDLGEVWQANFKPRPENRIPMRSSSAMPVDAVILRQSYPF